MPILILVSKLVLLVCIKSALIMSFPARTINNTPLNAQGNACVNIVDIDLNVITFTLLHAGKTGNLSLSFSVEFGIGHLITMLVKPSML